MRVVLTGGGTGGHVFPLIAVARELRQQKTHDCECLYIGVYGGTLAKTISEAMAKENISTRNIITGKMRRYFSFKNILDAFLFPVGLVQSLWHLLFFMPDVVFSKGGYAAVPVVIAAFIYRIPILTHDSDATPGLANKIIGRLAKRIAIAYPAAKEFFPEEKVVLTGNPLRAEMNQGVAQRAREKYNLTESQPVILVLGGSLGADAINSAVVRALPEMTAIGQIIHQTGNKHLELVVKGAAQQGVKADRDRYYPRPFFSREELADLFAVSDLVISRAGANTIAEIAANKKPSILIPLKTAANNEQRMNAYSIAQVGGTLVLEESNLGPNILANKMKKILGDKELSDKMAQNVAPFHHPDAAELIARGLIELAR
ncbi:MAG: undecaprenyldiphospho-muramoylpentapeptide beta-N-acetylglucosaminyltransferase [Candidatus Moranbacteria bacterium]|nr:undecaprenyldiphospho-muramoylpentapeptide beta-N-acetylglucosaminyltransferase [Candidatus Moranbacteria bacterium]